MNPASLKNLTRPWDGETARAAARRRWDGERERQRQAEEAEEFSALADGAFEYVLGILARVFGAYRHADDKGRRSLLRQIERFVARYGPDALDLGLEPNNGADDG